MCDQESQIIEQYRISFSLIMFMMDDAIQKIV